MGLKEEYICKVQDVPHRRRQAPAGTKESSSPCMHKDSIKDPNKWVWMPTVPSWEKEFIEKIGLFTWDKFLRAKRYIKFHHKIMEWKDSAAKEAFHRAKNRFNGLTSIPDDDQFYSPDLYIDEIDWDNVVCTELMCELESAKELKSEYNQEDENSKEYWQNIQVEIEPSGWDVDVQEFSQGKVLTGLLVG